MVATLLAKHLHAPDLTYLNITGAVDSTPERLPVSTVDPALLDLPWSIPLEQWTAEHIAALPKGISRHVVRSRVAAFVGGFVTLVARMRDRPDTDGPDDGAVV